MHEQDEHTIRFLNLRLAKIARNLTDEQLILLDFHERDEQNPNYWVSQILRDLRGGEGKKSKLRKLPNLN